jgi:thioredoxin reductase (NADPH)
VHVIVRGHDLGKSMSRYLVDRVEHIKNVHIHRGAVVSALEGDGHLQALRIRDDAGAEARIAAPSLFRPDALHGDIWRAHGRAPFFLETSLPGVFAAGDVRSGSVKRCASAVGEGPMSVSFVHACLDAPA